MKAPSKLITAGSVGLLMATVLLPRAAAWDQVALLIDSRIYNSSSIAAKLARYVEDVEARFPVNLEVRHDMNFNSMTPSAVRSYISDLHYNHDIKGVILAGTIPYALWKNYAPGTNDKGINSFYYEDLDGSFTDTDGDGYDDYHDWGDNVGPEVWVCWMRPPANDQIGGLEHFLDKTHDYYVGNVSFNHKALVAAHNDYDNNIYGGFHMFDEMADIYGPNNVDVDGAGSDPVIASEYLSALQNNRYEICNPMGHANSSLQAWDSGYVWGSPDVENMTGGAVMTFIYGCHSAAFNENPNTNIAMMYVMGESIGQAASGTSWSYGTEGKWYIFDVLEAGGSLADGWWNLEVTKNTPEYMKARYGDWLDTNRHLWGDNLLGNPFLYALWVGGEVLRGDVDNNGTVDGLDLTAILAAWNSTEADPNWNGDADVDHSGIIDGLDLTAVLSNWGQTLSTAAVPEPTTPAMLVFGASALLRRRRTHN